jgi:hypothetical protein
MESAVIAETISEHVLGGGVEMIELPCSKRSENLVGGQVSKYQT